MRELSPEKRVEYGRKLADQVNAGLMAKAELIQRWDRLDRLVSGQDLQGMELPWQGAVYRALPTILPKRDTWVSQMAGAIMGADPVFSVDINLPIDAEAISYIESDVNALVARTDFGSALRSCLRHVWMYGNGFLRASMAEKAPVQDEFGWFGSSNADLQIECIHPRAVVAYPAGMPGVARQETFGWRFGMTIRDAKAKIARGEWWDGPLGSGTDPLWTAKSIQEEPSTLTEQDDAGDFWELWHRCRHGDDTDRWYVAIVCVETGHLLHWEPAGLSVPWYFHLAMTEEPDSFWVAESRGNDLQQLALAINDAFNLGMWANEMNAFPASGASGWALDPKFAQIKPGRIVPLSADGKVFPLTAGANPGDYLQRIQMLGVMADRASRISQQASGQPESSSDNTATAAQLRAQNEGVGLSDDLDQANRSLSRLASYVCELYARNVGALKRAYGDALKSAAPLEDADTREFLRLPWVWSLGGRVPLNSPEVQSRAAKDLVGTLAMLTPDVMQTLAMTGVDPSELVRTLIQSSPLRNKDAILAKDGQSEAAAAVLPVGGMGMVPEVPGVGTVAGSEFGPAVGPDLGAGAVPALPGAVPGVEPAY